MFQNHFFFEPDFLQHFCHIILEISWYKQLLMPSFFHIYFLHWLQELPFFFSRHILYFSYSFSLQERVPWFRIRFPSRFLTESSLKQENDSLCLCVMERSCAAPLLIFIIFFHFCLCNVEGYFTVVSSICTFEIESLVQFFFVFPGSGFWKQVSRFAVSTCISLRVGMCRRCETSKFCHLLVFSRI